MLELIGYLYNHHPASMSGELGGIVDRVIDAVSACVQDGQTERSNLLERLAHSSMLVDGLSAALQFHAQPSDN